MVINYTNINKTKENLNSDGYQLHQYQQSEQSHLTGLTEQKILQRQMTWEIRVLD